MKYFFLVFTSIISLTGCQSICPLEGYTDGGPVPNAIQYPIQSYLEVSIEQLNAWGFSVDATDLGEGQFGLYIRAQQPAIKEINSGELRVNFSLWSDDEQFVFAMPNVSLNQGPFLLLEGYTLRIVVNTTNNALDLQPGVGYMTQLDPADYL